MKKRLFTNGFLLYAILLIIITVSWQAYEYIRFGEIQPDPFHSLIAALLAFFISKNFIDHKHYDEMLKYHQEKQYQLKQVNSELRSHIREATDIINRAAKKIANERGEQFESAPESKESET